MKRVLVCVTALSLVVPAVALPGTKTYSLQSFDGISVATGIELKAQIGPQQSVIAETDGSDFSDLAVDVRGGVLMIGRPPRWFWWRWNPPGPHFKVTVTVPALREVEASSGAFAEITGPLTGDAEIAVSSSGRAHISEVKGGSVALHISSSGNLEIDTLQAKLVGADASSSGRVTVSQLQSDTIEMHATSSGAIVAAGSCSTLRAEASSSGRVIADNLKCVDVQAQASSGGSIAAHASTSLEGHASSGAQIIVAGKPDKLVKEQSSGGSIDILN